MNPSHRKPNGFSLMELMVVMVIFGILAAIAVPGIMGMMRSAKLTGAANTIEADFHYARSIANSQRKTCAIVFGPSSYRIMEFSPTTVLRTRTLPRGVTCTSSDTASFYAWGLTDPITVTVSDDHSAQVMHLRTTGKLDHD